jgi:hypothetical protein
VRITANCAAQNRLPSRVRPVHDYALNEAAFEQQQSKSCVIKTFYLSLSNIEI